MTVQLLDHYINIFVGQYLVLYFAAKKTCHSRLYRKELEVTKQDAVSKPKLNPEKVK